MTISLRIDVIGLLFALIQFFEFLQLGRGQNGSQFVQFPMQVLALGSGKRRSTSTTSAAAVSTPSSP